MKSVPDRLVFSPLDQGRLTGCYLKGIPADSRAAQNTSLRKDSLTPKTMDQVKRLNEIAESRHQTLAEMALAWCLRNNDVNTVLIGAFKERTDPGCDIAVLDHLDFSLRRN